MKLKIGVIGLGIVGGTLFKWFKKKKYEVYGYDKFKDIGSLEEIDKTQIIFLCVPTPYRFKLGYDLSSLEENVTYFKNSKIFVIKSTVLPGTTEYFQKKFKRHKFFHNPEFLREKTPWQDFLKPDLQLVGYVEKQDINVARKVLNLLPKAPYTKIVEAKSSELVKMAINNFLALKVIFANQIYDLTEKLKINYDEVREILENEPRLGKSHFKVLHNDYRGFGGKCLPKEVSSLITFYKKFGLKPELFEIINKINYRLLKKQNLIKKLKQYWLNNKS